MGRSGHENNTGNEGLQTGNLTLHRIGEHDLFRRSGLASLQDLRGANMIVNLDSPEMLGRTFLGLPVDSITNKVYPHVALVTDPQDSVYIVGPSKRAGKTDSLINPNLWLRRLDQRELAEGEQTEKPQGADIVTSTKTDSLIKVIPQLLAAGRKVMVFDPTGEFAKHNGRFINQYGIPLVRWSPTDGEGTHDWAVEQAELLANAGKVGKETGPNKEYWKSYTQNYLAPVLHVVANADITLMKAKGARSKIELLKKLADVTEENVTIVSGALQDEIDRLHGKMDALTAYVKAIENTQPQQGEEGPQQERITDPIEFLRTQLQNAQERHKEMKNKSDITSDILLQAKNNHMEQDQIEGLNQQMYSDETEKHRLAGVISQTQEMLDTDIPMSTEQALSLEDRLHKQADVLIPEELAALAKTRDQITSMKSDSETAHAYDQMVKMVVDPYDNVDTLISAETEGYEEVIEPESFLREGGTLFIYSPLDKVKKIAPIGIALLTRFMNIAMQYRDSDNPLPILPRFLLDEVVTTAADPDLPDKATATRGALEFLTVTQAKSYMQNLWGEKGTDALLTNHQVWVIMPQGANTETLEEISDLIGYHEVPVHSTTSGREPSSTITKERRRIVDVATLNSLPDHMAVVRAGGLITFIQLRIIEDLEKDMGNKQSIPQLLKEVDGAIYTSDRLLRDALYKVIQAMGDIYNSHTILRTLGTMTSEANVRPKSALTQAELSSRVADYLKCLYQSGTELAQRLGIDPLTIPALITYNNNYETPEIEGTLMGN